MAKREGVPPFWQTTPLRDMTAAQWESLCDGCGRCCLVKLEDEDSGAVAYTDVACRLFDPVTCRCTDYAHRQEQVPDCVRLTPEAVETLSWLPPTCAYRLVQEGKDLPHWHPLRTGDAASVAAAGVAVTGRVAGLEDAFGLFELVEHIVSWPMRWPRGAKRAPVAASTDGTGAPHPAPAAKTARRPRPRKTDTGRGPADGGGPAQE